MPPIRRVVPWGRVDVPANPAIGDNLAHDPRDFGAGFDKSRYPDQARLWELRKNVIRNGIADIGSFLDYLDARNLPPQIVKASRVAMITGTGLPVKLIDKNLRRQAWQVSNF